MYITVKQAAEKWRISDRRVRILCAEGKIPGVIREKLFAGYVNARLDSHLMMLEE